MQSLQIELVLMGTKRRFSFDGFGNRFRIAVVILIRLHGGPYKLRGYQTHLVPLLRNDLPESANPPRPPSRSVTRADSPCRPMLLTRKLTSEPTLGNGRRGRRAERWFSPDRFRSTYYILHDVILRLAFCQLQSLSGWLPRQRSISFSPLHQTRFVSEIRVTT
jgi:hypothetical protein